MSDPKLGDIIGGYVLEDILGQGGMGCVFRARHTLLGREAAVKVLLGAHVEDEALVSRFFQEARIVNEIRHPNIVDIIDFVHTQDPKRVAYIMEYVGATPLDEALRTRRFSMVQVCAITRQIASALAAVHEAGVVHRDLKPANVLIEYDEAHDNAICAKLVDFGIAKVDDERGPRTATGMVLGTPSYMAPEQIAADVIDGAADVYALGAILYELATAYRLFRGPNAEIMRAKIGGHVPQLDALRQVPAGATIEAIVAQCLAFEPERRPTVTQLLAALDALLVELEMISQGHHVPSLLPRYEPRTKPATISERPSNNSSSYDSSAARFLDTVQPRYSRGRVALGAAAGLLLVLTGGFWFANTAPVAADELPVITELPVEAAVLPEPEPLEEEAPAIRPARFAPVIVNSEPSGAVVSANGEVLGETPLELEVDPDRPRDVEVAISGYRARSLTLDGRRSNLDVRLEKIRERAPRERRERAVETGKLDVQAWTTGGRALPAEVSIGGKSIDQRTPFVTAYKPGEYELTVSAPGYPPRKQTVQVRSDETTKVYVVVDLER